MMIHRKGDWLSERVADELIMMSVAKGLYVGMSEVGACIWEFLEQPRSLDDICAHVAMEFEITPAACRPDVEKFLRELESKDAVSFDPS